jgi:hypothetical protein
MKSASSVCLASLVGGVLAGGTVCFGGHGHASTHPAASHPTAHHEAPKKTGAKPAHHPAPKPSEHAPHKQAGGKPSAAKPLSPEEHKPNALLSGSKAHDKTHEQHHDEHHHDDHHHDHHHWHEGHEWVGGVDVENGSVGASVDGAAGIVVPAGGVAGAAAVVPDVGGAVPSGRPQIHFSVAPSERDSYDTAAQAAGMSRSEWIRARLNAAAGRELK